MRLFPLKVLSCPQVWNILPNLSHTVGIFLLSLHYSFADVCNHRFTMASADFSPFVVTHGFHTLFPSADETSLSTTRFFPSIYLPHLLQLIPSSYWTLICLAILSLTVAWCDFCTSDQRFAIRLPSDSPHVNHSSSMKRTPLSLAMSFPLLGQTRDFHPLETCAVRHTKKTTR